MMYFWLKINLPCRQRLFLFPQTQSVKCPDACIRPPVTLDGAGRFSHRNVIGHSHSLDRLWRTKLRKLPNRDQLASRFFSTEGHDVPNDIKAEADKQHILIVPLALQLVLDGRA